MKKALLYFLFTFMFLINTVAFAEEEESMVKFQPATMPTDAEIMETINKFNFDKAQKEYLFKETKKRLEEMYANQDFSSILQGDSTLIDNSLETKEKAKTKKYSSHSSLTKKSE